MLAALHISNFVLIEKQDIRFSEGLNVFSGETGAGKSILLDALGLCLGAKAEPKMVKVGAEQAVVSVEFVLNKDVFSSLRLVFEEAGLMLEDDVLIIRRVVPTSGRSRAFVNDEPVSHKFLAQLQDYLVDIHGQGAVGQLARRAFQRDALDFFGQLLEQKEQLQIAYDQWRHLCDDRQRFMIDLEALVGQRDQLYAEYEEFDQMLPLAGEEEQLAEQRQTSQKRKKMVDDLVSLLALLNGDHGAEAQLIEAFRRVGRWGEDIPDSLTSLEEWLDKSLELVREAAGQIEDVLVEIDADDRTLSQVEDRLFELRDLARKYRVPASQLHEHHNVLRQRVHQLENMTEQLRVMDEEIQQALEGYRKLAKALSQQRKYHAQILQEAIHKELEAIKLGGARFEVGFAEREAPSAAGSDDITFMAAMNRGQDLAVLHEAASGGEQSRFVLALRVALGHQRQVGVQIFDEVDQGIGGAAADAVGERLRSLSKHAQVLLVTHSPQVAAKGDRHFLVEKKDNGIDTVSQIFVLDHEQRIEEIARMLSGDRVTTEARKAAARLLL